MKVKHLAAAAMAALGIAAPALLSAPAASAEIVPLVGSDYVGLGFTGPELRWVYAINPAPAIGALSGGRYEAADPMYQGVISGDPQGDVADLLLWEAIVFDGGTAIGVQNPWLHRAPIWIESFF